MYIFGIMARGSVAFEKTIRSRGLRRLVMAGRQERKVPFGEAAALVCCGMATSTMSEEKPPHRAPWAGVLDKETTGVPGLPEKSDGRGVVIAVLDTGVDPAAEGLQKTTDGSYKVIDVVDATGAGDVSLSRVKVVDGWIENEATGRKLRVDATKWKFDANPDEWRVGGKNAETLWPRSVRDRVAEEERRKVLAKHDVWLAAARTAAHAGKDDKGGIESKELEARVSALERAKKDLSPSKDTIAPLLDVLVWTDSDGVDRCVVVDGSVEPDLTARDDVVPLASFTEARKRGERAYSSFHDNLLTYSVNFYGEDVASIVTPSGDHGTHVAAIAAAYDAEDEDKCGLAPGAQIVSVKIGDARLGTMETGTALARAATTAQMHKVDLINLSYGEASGLCNAGAFAAKAQKLVDEDPGLIFVSSAGNNGPGLSTVGAPGSTTGALVGVGAMVTPTMRGDMYSQRPNDADQKMMYSFSSRGPATDGDWGVSVCAPGGAVASVPRYTLQPQRLMHGTSMSSPNACGSLACLLGTLKAENIPYTANAVRRAIEATAKPFSYSSRVPYGSQPLDRGQGVLAVDAAYEALKVSAKEASIAYKVSIPERAAGSGAPAARGIYLREPFETDAPTEVSVVVTPKFFQDATTPAETKASFRRNVRLETSAGANWVEAGNRMVLTYAPKAATIKIDTTKLPRDTISCAEVLGFDADDPTSQVPLFRVPITVVRPVGVESDNAFSFKEEFRSGEISRHFVVAPDWATSATLSVRCAADASKRLVHLATTQLAPQEPYTHYHLHKRIWMSGDDRVVSEISDVSPGRTMEICVSQDWLSLEPCVLDVEIVFKGDASDENIVLRGTRSVVSVLMKNESPDPLVASPVAKLKRWRRPMRPIEASIKPCPTERDDFTHSAGTPPKRAYELQLTYEWTHGGNGDGATLRFAGDEQIYESPFEGQRARVYEKSTGRTLGWRDGRSFSEIKGFEQGMQYVAVLELRSESSESLDRLKDAELWLEWSLKSDLTTKCYGTKQAAYTDGTAFKDVKLKAGESKPVYVAPPSEGDLPKEVLPGDVLLGSVTYARSPALSMGASRRASHVLWYYVPPAKHKKSNGKKKNPKPLSAPLAVVRGEGMNSDALKKLASATFDAQIKFLAESEDLDESSSLVLAQHLVEAAGEDRARVLEVRRAALKGAAHAKDLNVSTPLSTADPQRVLAAAELVKDAVNETQIALHVATRAADVAEKSDDDDDNRDFGAASHKALVEALRWTCEAKLALVHEEASDGALEDLTAALAELDKWVDTRKASNPADARLRAIHEKLRDRPGLAIEALSAWLDTKKKKADDVKRAKQLRAELYSILGWDDWAIAETKAILNEFPPKTATP